MIRICGYVKVQAPIPVLFLDEKQERGPRAGGGGGGGGAYDAKLSLSSLKVIWCEMAAWTTGGPCISSGVAALDMRSKLVMLPAQEGGSMSLKVPYV